MDSHRSFSTRPTSDSGCSHGRLNQKVDARLLLFCVMVALESQRHPSTFLPSVVDELEVDQRW